MAVKLILASNSPRRRELMSLVGYKYEVIPSNASELTDGEIPSELVRINALNKAKEVYDRVGGGSVVVGADTVVCYNGNILGKPKDVCDAKAMIKMLSSTTHEVITGYAVVGDMGEKSDACVTKVKFRNLTDEEIDAYVKTLEPMDKAGAYGIQEKGCLLAESFEGDYFNIVGLPVSRVYEMLKDYGVTPDWM